MVTERNVTPNKHFYVSTSGEIFKNDNRNSNRKGLVSHCLETKIINRENIGIKERN